MKRENLTKGMIRRAAMMLLMMMLTTVTAWADGLSGSGNAANPYLIS